MVEQIKLAVAPDKWEFHAEEYNIQRHGPEEECSEVILFIDKTMWIKYKEAQKVVANIESILMKMCENEKS